MKTTQLSVTIDLRIFDPETFAQDARVRAIAEGVEPDDVEATYTVDNLGACAQMLFDPGTSPSRGCEILDSYTG